MLKKKPQFAPHVEAFALAGAVASPPGAHGRPVRFVAASRWHAVGVALLVVALHAAALYAIGRTPQTAPPQLSIPLTVSFATAAEPMATTREAAPPKPKPKSKPKAPPVQRATAPRPQPAPTADSTPTEAPPGKDTARNETPMPPAVSAPRFDAAYLNNPSPAYPPLSRRLGEEGRVLLRALVDADGRTREVQVEVSSGHARLDRAAQEAVARWRFVPARRGDEPTHAWVRVPISFMLEQG